MCQALFQALRDNDEQNRQGPGPLKLAVRRGDGS